MKVAVGVDSFMVVFESNMGDFGATNFGALDEVEGKHVVAGT